MLFRLELNKLLQTPAIIGFVLLCLIINAVVITACYDGNEYQSEAEPVNVFEGYKASDLAEWYIKKYGVTDGNAENIRAKYAKLQPVIDEKAADGDALSLYFGERTYYRHALLFGTMFTAIIAESCLLALFLTLVSVTYENACNTEHIIFSSKTGRRVMRVKLTASLTATIVITAIILAVSLLIFFAQFDFSGAWDANVSSSFNYTVGEYGKPFITWHSFTVAGYLWATIGAALLLAVCFCLLGYTAGVLVRSGYGAFISTVAVIVVMAFAEPLFPVGSIMKSALNLNPVRLWWNSGAWFTDGGAAIVWANFESVGLTVSFLTLSIIAFIATKTYKKRELL